MQLGQWTTNQICDLIWLDLGLTNLQRFWFGFDNTSSNVWHRIFEHLTSITRLGISILVATGQSDSEFSATNWLSQTLIGQFKLKLQGLHSPSRATWPRSTFSSIDDFTSKFIEIRGNPSVFYVIDCIRIHYDTQINKIIKITHKINTFTLLRHQLLKVLSHSTMSVFIKSSTSIRSNTPSMRPDNNQLCKHSTDSTDFIESQFRQSLKVNLALDISTWFHLKVVPAKHSLHFSWHWRDRI